MNQPQDGHAQKAALLVLVDDYLDGREMYADALTFAGFRVVEAASGRRRCASRQSNCLT
jgi:hypothetical protein